MLGVDTYAPDVNGSAQFSRRLALGLTERGHEVHVVCASDRGPGRVESVDGVIEHRIRSYRYPWAESFRVCMPWDAKLQVNRLLTDLRPDVAHLQCHILLGRALAAAARSHDVPLVATNHFMPENVFGYVPLPRALTRRLVSSWVWWDLNRVFGRADLVTAPTPRAVELLEANTNIRGARAVSCGIDSDRYWQASQLAGTGDGPSVLFVGRLDQEKHVDQLIRAFAQLPSDLSASLEIIGDGEERSVLRALAARLGVEDRVHFHGFVSDAQLLAAYGRCAVFCMPGVAELQSLVTLEAMSAGKPVVAADAMALPHLVHHGRNGWLFAPGDVEDLTGRLSDLLSDPQRRRRMGEASRAIVAEHALSATLDSFEEIYNRVAGRREVAVDEDEEEAA
ncbi:glycosyltransferase [Microlunatus panaciterrae]|uniref:glycosyltransferase n=1 Tax=Microlunatus panaciterrae TaxID=400768 RepID=UPI0030842631